MTTIRFAALITLLSAGCLSPLSENAPRGENGDYSAAVTWTCGLKPFRHFLMVAPEGNLVHIVATWSEAPESRTGAMDDETARAHITALARQGDFEFNGTGTIAQPWTIGHAEATKLGPDAEALRIARELRRDDFDQRYDGSPVMDGCSYEYVLQDDEGTFRVDAEADAEPEALNDFREALAAAHGG